MCARKIHVLHPTTPSRGITGGWVGIIGGYDCPHSLRGGTFDYFVHYSKRAVYGNSLSGDKGEHVLLHADLACLANSCTYV